MNDEELKRRLDEIERLAREADNGWSFIACVLLFYLLLFGGCK